MNTLWEKSVSSGEGRNLLRLMLKHEVFKFGKFELKSGQISPIYIDLRECFGFPELMELASKCLQNLISNSGAQFRGIVGVPYAALPYSSIVCQSLKEPLIIIRKEAKSYGTKKLIEGKYEPGQRVIIIEDVVTTGGSIIGVVDTLRGDGLIVEDVFCLLNREQGGAEKLSEHGIRLHSLLDMQTILSFLISVQKIDQNTWNEIVQALNLPFTKAHVFTISTDLEDTSCLPKIGSGRLPLGERSRENTSALNRQLFSLMLKKESNLCLAIDYTETEKVLELADKAGPFVVSIKIHSDIIVDFNDKFIEKFVELSKKHEFLIFEDRKFGDIGNTNLLQLKGAHKIAEWADIVTVHAVQGCDSISGVFREIINDSSYRLKGILLIAQLSCKGNLTSLNGYTEYVSEIGSENNDVVCGFICQNRISSNSDLLHWTPGVNIDAQSDNAGQKWRGVETAIIEQQNDIIIVGRGVTGSSQPIQELKRYREAGWAALTG